MQVTSSLLTFSPPRTDISDKPFSCPPRQRPIYQSRYIYVVFTCLIELNNACVGIFEHLTSKVYNKGTFDEYS